MDDLWASCTLPDKPRTDPGGIVFGRHYYWFFASPLMCSETENVVKIDSGQATEKLLPPAEFFLVTLNLAIFYHTISQSVSHFQISHMRYAYLQFCVVKSVSYSRDIVSKNFRNIRVQLTPSLLAFYGTLFSPGSVLMLT